MNQNTLTANPVSDAKCVLERLENHLQGLLNGRIRNLRLKLHDAGVVLHGLARTYHAKQMAQHAVMTESDLPVLANEIEVC